MIIAVISVFIHFSYLQFIFLYSYNMHPFGPSIDQFSLTSNNLLWYTACQRHTTNATLCLRLIWRKKISPRSSNMMSIGDNGYRYIIFVSMKLKMRSRWWTVRAWNTGKFRLKCLALNEYRIVSKRVRGRLVYPHPPPPTSIRSYGFRENFNKWTYGYICSGQTSKELSRGRGSKYATVYQICFCTKLCTSVCSKCAVFHHLVL